jgi:hypothetical protein
MAVDVVQAVATRVVIMTGVVVPAVTVIADQEGITDNKEEQC